MVCAASKKEVISTDAAPGAVGPYSQAIKTGGFLYVSGCIPLVPGTKEFNSDKVDEQADQALKNMGEVLKAGGCSYGDVVSARRGARASEREREREREMDPLNG